MRHVCLGLLLVGALLHVSLSQSLVTHQQFLLLLTSLQPEHHGHLEEVVQAFLQLMPFREILLLFSDVLNVFVETVLDIPQHFELLLHAFVDLNLLLQLLALVAHHKQLPVVLFSGLLQHYQVSMHFSIFLSILL